MKRTQVSFETSDGSHRRPVGLFGRADFEGITSIGLIFMDPGCRPRTGGFINPTSEDDQKVVYVEKEESNGGLIAGIVITVILLVGTIALAAYLFLYIRRNKQKIQILETEKADWGATAGRKGQKPIVVCGGDDFDAGKDMDDSARVGLKAGANRYENDDAETNEI